MFTGIIEAVGTVTSVTAHSGGKRLSIDVGPMASEARPGASVCVSGVCLTVAGVRPPVLEFDVITETLNKSTLGGLAAGDNVNLERSLRAGDRIDGHFVQGHVDGTATVTRVVSTSEQYVIHLRTEPHLRPYIVPKGSVAVDGVSLTIAGVEGDVFSVALIPTTLRETTLQQLTAGDRVNVETDIIARTIVHQLSRIGSSDKGVSMEMLKEAGYA
ncbi:MAG: riboflavin synthase [Phycisphaerales bacterium]|nr:MAG: riboflavin synthase [Phycisphaerales bacterium]